MRPLDRRTRKGERTTPRRAVRPHLEGLEDRLLLYSYTGDHFQYGNRITWSIVPDGTNLGGVNSNFVSTMNAKFGSGNWIQAVEDAFAQWRTWPTLTSSRLATMEHPLARATSSKAAIASVTSGSAATSSRSNILAYTLLPPAANGGSDSGDIFFNTNQNWNIGGDYDLETVLVHELGHAVAGLGDESTNPNAVEYTYYNGIKQTPTSDDIAGIQAVWGPRPEDGLAVGWSNFTPSHAAAITPFLNTSNDQIALQNLDVAVPGQVYWFKFTTPANASNNLTVQVQSQYLSELSPLVQLYNGYGQGLVQTAASLSSYGATIDASIANATPNTTYYIRVSGTSTNANGTGVYAMNVNMGNSGIVLTSPPNTQVAAQPDQGGGGAFQLLGGLIGGLPTLAQLQAAGDFFNFLPSTTSPGSFNNSGFFTIFSLPTAISVNATAPNTTSSTTNPWNNSGSCSISLGNLNSLVANLPTILIGLETPNYDDGLMNFGF